ncbi:MAG: ATP-dependent Clp protease adaptor ClpS [Rhodovibrio sp.]|nr:ATP-dependent Clp protease adaptor ClpS [Rhodovibrio sp.]
MSEDVVTPKTNTSTKTARPRMYKVLLHNDDYTPREFVVAVLYVRVRDERVPRPTA